MLYMYIYECICVCRPTANTMCQSVTHLDGTRDTIPRLPEVVVGCVFHYLLFIYVVMCVCFALALGDAVAGQRMQWGPKPLQVPQQTITRNFSFSFEMDAKI